MTRVLVTGAAGYIGSILVPMLLARGWAVDAVDLYTRGDTVLAACCPDPNFNPVRGDARDEALMSGLLAKADVVIPLAALVGAPLCKRDPLNAQTTNSDAVRMLAGKLSRNQRMVYPTTNSGYGVGEKGQFCTEETPLRPISLYGTSKMEAEEATCGAGGVSLRLATVFGMAPRMRLDLLVNDFTWRAVTDRAVVIFEGHFMRNYIHIRDVVKGFLHALDNYETMGGQAYNLGLSSANLSKLQLCAKIREHVPEFVFLEAPIGEDPDKRDYIVSNEKLERTGWTPDWDLDRGIQELLRGYRMLRNGVYSNV
ncbi:MAG: NAD-dependent epimerase/dehydratase [Hyphomonadaceae bacterium]|nr:NAD-dependent epimerase/dehydratase [Hyphomonadaceae bacterium]